MQDFQYMVVSFSHKNMDLDMREQLAFSQEQYSEILTQLRACAEIKEAILLSTCNRIEIYVCALDRKIAKRHILGAIAKLKGLDYELLEQKADVRLNQYAIYHIFCVASSLDSLIVGETQITGQLKDAYKFALEHSFCGKDLSRVLDYAFKCAAKVRTQCNIGSSHTSVASAAVNMLAQKLKAQGSSLDGKNVALLGVGEMGVLALKHLLKHNVKITLLNRNMQNALNLKDEILKKGAESEQEMEDSENFSNLESKVLENAQNSEQSVQNGYTKDTQILKDSQKMQKSSNTQKNLQIQIDVKPFSELQSVLDSVDVFISATGAPHSVITKDMIKPIKKSRIWFDLAVPRDIEPSNECKNLQVFCVDDLQEIVSTNLKHREESAQGAHKIIENGVRDFFVWLNSLGAEPLIKHLRELAKDASYKELERAIKKGFLKESERECVEKILHSAFNVFLHSPTARIRAISNSSVSDSVIDAVKSVFEHDVSTRKKD